MEASTTSDDAIMQATFEAASEAVSDMITGALQKGLAIKDLAVVIERRFDGGIVTGCADRAGVARQFGNDLRLAVEARATITRAVTTAAPDELPIIVLVHGEGYLTVGVRRERGMFVGVS